jgi:hypothetical protein
MSCLKSKTTPLLKVKQSCITPIRSFTFSPFFCTTGLLSYAMHGHNAYSGVIKAGCFLPSLLFSGSISLIHFSRR